MESGMTCLSSTFQFDSMKITCAEDSFIGSEPNVRILQNNVTLESERYTAECLYIECLNIA